MNSQRLPIFPLSIVLFPGVTVPLHLFEPRYRQLLKDIQDTDRRFGIVCPIRDSGESRVPVGRVGCIAHVTEIEMLPDGRSNILVVGRERFAIDHFLDDEAPYHLAMVSVFEDHHTDVPPVALTLAADELAQNFRRVVRAVHALSDRDASAPTLPDSATQIPWTVASMIDLDLDARQRLLSDRMLSSRIATVDRVLRNALPDLEIRAALHVREAEAE